MRDQEIAQLTLEQKEAVAPIQEKIRKIEAELNTKLENSKHNGYLFKKFENILYHMEADKIKSEIKYLTEKIESLSVEKKQKQDAIANQNDQIKVY